MSHEDDVQALKREVELLKTLLVQEREKSESASQREPSLTRPAPPAAKSTSSTNAPQLRSGVSSATEERSPRKPSALSNGSGTAGQRGRSLRWSSAILNGQSTPAQHSASAPERLLYLQHVPVGTKRGKWWLKDRQVLSRNAPSPYDDCIALKVRETWLWSGRTVVVDKIVTCPQPTDERDDDECENEGAEPERSRDNEVREGGDEASNRLNEAQSSQDAQAASAPAISPSRSAADATQLVHESLLPAAPASAPSEQLENASARMEHRMTVAEQEENEEVAAVRLE
ncbi:hypothetical protein PybrP1_006877 [[Pythium] brassicae (nom. inval.)]|nr:hypothetical protein PybrP1_006877 [[Pythium] brassicae (nom. inval.)]